MDSGPSLYKCSKEFAWIDAAFRSNYTFYRHITCIHHERCYGGWKSCSRSHPAYHIGGVGDFLAVSFSFDNDFKTGRLGAVVPSLGNGLPKL